MTTISTGGQRPLTLQDIIQVLNDRADQGTNPDISSGEVLNDAVAATETVHASDGAPTFTAASVAVYDNGKFGFGQYS